MTDAVASPQRKWIISVIFDPWFFLINIKRTKLSKKYKVNSQKMYMLKGSSGIFINRSGLNSIGFGKNLAHLPLTYCGIYSQGFIVNSCIKNSQHMNKAI